MTIVRTTYFYTIPEIVTAYREELLTKEEAIAAIKQLIEKDEELA